MSEMVERVARALAEADGHEEWDRLPRDRRGAREISAAASYQEQYIDDARAAIEAMREPTEAMEDAGQEPISRAYVDAVLPDFLTGWQAAIEVALAEPQVSSLPAQEAE